MPSPQPLSGPALFRGWRYGLRSGLFDRGLLPGRCGLLRCRRFRLCRPDCRPSLFRGGDDCGPASGSQFSFRLRCRGWRLRCSFALDLGPPLFLGKSHSAANRETPLPTLWFCGFRRCSGFSGDTIEHCPEFSDLIVDQSFLVFKTDNGRFDDMAVQFGYWHVFLSHSYSHINQEVGAATQQTQQWHWSYTARLKPRLMVCRSGCRLAGCGVISSWRKSGKKPIHAGGIRPV
jgi:hypothetical protein